MQRRKKAFFYLQFHSFLHVFLTLSFENTFLSIYCLVLLYSEYLTVPADSAVDPRWAIWGTCASAWNSSPSRGWTRSPWWRSSESSRVFRLSDAPRNTNLENYEKEFDDEHDMSKNLLHTAGDEEDEVPTRENKTCARRARAFYMTVKGSARFPQILWLIINESVEIGHFFSLSCIQRPTGKIDVTMDGWKNETSWSFLGDLCKMIPGCQYQKM